MSPMRKTAGKKVAATRKRNAWGVARQLRKKPLQLARGVPQVRRPQKPACARELQERQQQPAPAKKRPRPFSQCKSKNRPHQSPRCRPHPKPRSLSKLRQNGKSLRPRAEAFSLPPKAGHFPAPILGN